MYHGKWVGWRTVFALLIFLVISPKKTHAVSVWPGEPWGEAEILTHLDSDFAGNLSGAHWNPNTGTLWVCLNGPGKFWSLTQNANGVFEVAYQGQNRGEWSPNGDLEGITQADLNEASVYVIAEGIDKIRKYDVSQYGVVRPLQEWDISQYVPPYGSSLGSEGITFVPDDWLSANGFVDANGELYTSVNGMGGLMFIAHQNGGAIYVFDLDPNSPRVRFVGKYLTSRNESSGLEFDRSSGILYIWHNIDGNFLELSDLTSFVRPDRQRQFSTFEEYLSPKGGNLEGIAVTPAASADNWIFIVDDSNQDGAALMWFKDFLPAIELPTFTTEVRVTSQNDDAEERANGSMYLTSTDLELVEDRYQQLVGIRFASLEIPPDVTIKKATIQFAVDEATANETALKIYGENSANPSVYSSADQNISRRSKTNHFVEWVPEPWNLMGEVGEKQRTPDLTPIVQDIIIKEGWVSGNPIAFMIEGLGKRVAKSYNGAPALAPLLHVEYTLEEYVEPVSPIRMMDRSIISSADDAEEKTGGSMYLNSTDLELVEESTVQTVGVRFDQIDLPQGALVTKAYLQFSVDEMSGGDILLDIKGESSNFAQPFSSSSRNISSRNTTLAGVQWAPAEWNRIGESSENQRTADLTPIIQEIVSQGDWVSGNPMVFIITGRGKRVAKSFDGSPILAPRLHIEYQ